MSAHTSAHPGSKGLCEGLTTELARLQPGITRGETKGVCGLLHMPHSRFAYVYHVKTSPILRVYFRCSIDADFSDAPAAISITSDPDLSNPWAVRFPARFVFSDAGAIPEVARFLVGVAYPLSVAGDVRSVATRQVILMDREEEFSEGSEKFVIHRRKERNPQAVRRKKQMALETHGNLVCEACDFDFAEVYGPAGEGVAECHHRVHLSTLQSECRIRLKDLAIVCSNCHTILHRPPMPTVEELRQVVHARRNLR
jgi:hypothetical protein